MKPPIWETNYYNIPTYWTLISFMTFEPKLQLEYFEYPPLHIGDKDYKKPTKNVLMALISVLCEYDFIDDFDDEDILSKDRWFHKLLFNNSDETICSYESFMESDFWSKLRSGAKELLDATGLGVYPDIPKPIEFDYLVELVDPPEN